MHTITDTKCTLHFCLQNDTWVISASSWSVNFPIMKNLFLSFSFAGFFSLGFSDDVQSHIQYVHDLWFIICVWMTSSVYWTDAFDVRMEFTPQLLCSVCFEFSCDLSQFMLNPCKRAKHSVLFVQFKRPVVKNVAASDGRKCITNNVIVNAGFLMSRLIRSLSSTSCDVRVKSETPSRSSLWTPVDTLWCNKPSRTLCKYQSLLLANE